MKTTFDIRLISTNKKLYFLTQWILAIAFILLAIFYFSMIPSKNSSVELKALWFMEGIPMWIKKMALIGLFIISIGLLFNYLNSRSKFGELIIDLNELQICLPGKTTILKVEEIKEIGIVNQPTFFNTVANEQLTLFIVNKNAEINKVRLAHPLMENELMRSLESLEPKVNLLLSYDDSRWNY